MLFLNENSDLFWNSSRNSCSLLFVYSHWNRIWFLLGAFLIYGRHWIPIYWRHPYLFRPGFFLRNSHLYLLVVYVPLQHLLAWAFWKIKQNYLPETNRYLVNRSYVCILHYKYSTYVFRGLPFLFPVALGVEWFWFFILLLEQRPAFKLVLDLLTLSKLTFDFLNFVCDIKGSLVPSFEALVGTGSESCSSLAVFELTR